VSFVSPVELSTVRGKIVVKEIVIGLNFPQYANSLHTLDATGRVVGHSKFSGMMGIELIDLVKGLAGETRR
jgi:hypothetical protein